MKVKNPPKSFFSLIRHHLYAFFATDIAVIFLALFVLVLGLYLTTSKQLVRKTAHEGSLLSQNGVIAKELSAIKIQYDALSHENQYTINQTQKAEISHIHDTYTKSVQTYQSLLDLKVKNGKTDGMDTQLAQAISYLSDKNYASAEATLNTLTTAITAENNRLAALNAPIVPVQADTTSPANSSNSLPGSGFSRQSVTSDRGTFTVDIIAGDLNSTKVIVDTASSNDCSNNCPVMALGDYASRNGAYAGINGSFFCPADYPSCAGKTGSFDTLLMNKNKVYFNSSNNVYSTVPLVAFSGNSAFFYGASQQWGRDTGVDSVIAMQPMLVSGGNISYESSSDTKFNSKGPRGFIAAKGHVAYIGFIYNANMTDSSHVLKALGVDNAINLDEGGSTALWYGGGYKAGPGRNIPNAVLFLRK